MGRRILVLGGTGWLGREIASAAIARGEEVVCLARGVSGAVPDGARLIRADRDLPDAYEAVTGTWDEVVDLSYEPGLVASALDALADRAGHWTLVSTVSVYAHDDEPFADEHAALVEPDDLSRYADAKAAAERLSQDRLGDRLLTARPGLIVGPGDPSDRFGYWPARLHLGGRVLAPVTAERHVQVIDVADLAAWIVDAGAARRVGAVNAVGGIHSMDGFFETVREVTGHRGELVEVDDETLLAQGIRYWAGPRSLPLWLPSGDIGFAQRDGGAFLASGGRPRPLADTIRRTLDDEIARGVDRPRRAGLTAPEEEAVLRDIAR